MNIDVREYLRINPISVHDLTLSGNGGDFFLLFPEDGEGYEVQTQDQLFQFIKTEIFQDLIGQDGKLKVSVQDGKITWSDSIHLTNNQFVRYARKQIFTQEDPFPYVWEPLREEIERRLGVLEQGLQDKIDELRKKGILNYIGAVELQSSRFDLRDISKDFKFSEGFIWCYGKGKPQLEGQDQAVLGSQPLKHNHAETKSEVMTVPFAQKKGGGSLIGEVCVGNKVLVSSDNQFHIGNNTLTPYGSPENPDFTYPLYGQNVLDWRTPGKTHNNVPPCSNIMVKYMPFSREVLATSLQNRGEDVDVQISRRDDDYELGSVVEAKYDQSTVAGLEDFTKSDFTDSDLLLRLSSDGSPTGEIQMMKQTLKNLLDVFVGAVDSDLCVKTDERTYEIGELLRVKLDMELILKSDFLLWYNTCMSRFEKVQEQIRAINELIKSVPPLPYVGKIIISTKDDTEKKVISHYGGKKWRRIVNFLRGVDGVNPDLGRKMGEEYVCLRESNVPVHTHDVKKTGVLSEPPEDQTQETKAEWMCKQRGGSDKKIVSVERTDDNEVGGMANVQQGYQISPLEYAGKDYATIPHNNMPPYVEVYMWECLELTDYENTLVGPPGVYGIIYDMDGESESLLPSGIPHNYTSDDLPWEPPPASDASNYYFSGWTPEQIHKTARGTFTFKANWHSVVTFNANGGTLAGNSQTLNVPKGQKIGNFPEATREQHRLVGWYGNASGTGNPFTSESTVNVRNLALYAKWEAVPQELKQYTVTFNGNGGFTDGNLPKVSYTRTEGTSVNVPNFVRTGYTHQRWTPDISGSSVVVSRNRTYVAMWKKNQYTSTFRKNDGTDEKTVSTLYYGDRIVPPVYERQYYEFDGWEPEVDATMPDHDVTYVAQWKKSKYTMTFDPGEGSGGGCIVQEGGTALVPPGDPTRQGYTFTGWDPDPPDTVPTEDTTFHAQWTLTGYLVVFDANGGVGGTSNYMSYGEQIVAPEVTRSGYDFDRWLPEVAPTVPNHDVRYVAQWNLVSYQLFYNTNNREVSIPDDFPRRYTIEDSFTPYALPSSQMYQFAGWDPESLQVGSTGDRTFNAMWNARKFTVTWDVNGGDSISETSREIEYRDQIESFPDAQWTGHHLIGWTETRNGNDFVSVATEVYGNAIYYARWELDTDVHVTLMENVPITVTYDKNA